jgi:hypothetical protein
LGLVYLISEGGMILSSHTDSPLRGRIFERDCRIAKLERWRRILAWLVIMQAAAIAGGWATWMRGCM